MAFSTTTFVRLINPNAPATDSYTLSCTSWEEQEYEWRGHNRRALAGNLLSSQRTPKRTWIATAEFMTGADLEAFIVFISAGVFPTTGLPVWSKSLWLSPGGVDSALRRSSGTPPTVRVNIGSRSPFEHVEFVAATPTVPKLVIGWTAQITLVEV